MPRTRHGIENECVSDTHLAAVAPHAVGSADRFLPFDPAATPTATPTATLVPTATSTPTATPVPPAEPPQEDDGRSVLVALIPLAALLGVLAVAYALIRIMRRPDTTSGG